VEFNPDRIKGTLGELREIYGVKFKGNNFNNSIEDEQDITNFRVISDYMTSLLQSWIANRQFFRLDPSQPAFFGTQLVLISRQFNVITESVNEVRFILDSVFIGPNERQTLLLEFMDGTPDPMFLEDVLKEVERFATEEGPRLLRDGGKISVKNNILPVMVSLQDLVERAHNPKNVSDLPDGYRTARVQNSLDDLRDQIESLINLIKQVERDVPPSEEDLAVTGISTPLQEKDNNVSFAVYGENFTPRSGVVFQSAASPFDPGPIAFVSAQRIDVSFNLVDGRRKLKLTNGIYDIIVTNDDGETETLNDAFQFDGQNITAPPNKAFLSGIVPVSLQPSSPAPVGPPGASTAEGANLSARIDGLKTGQDSLSNQMNDLKIEIQKLSSRGGKK
jgi:hypothetical protein